MKSYTWLSFDLTGPVTDVSLKRASMMVLLIILSLLPVLAFNQPADLKFDRLTSEYSVTVKGLSQNSVYCLLQDSRGFIWIGTWDGLNKYNGYDFVIFNTENGLSNSTINALIEDDEKYIWIGTERGLNKLDRNTGVFEQFFNQPGNTNSLSNNFINHLYEDIQGNIWISTSFGLNKYDKKLKAFKTYNFFERGKDSLLTNYITRVMQDSRGWLWIGTRNGVHCYDPGQLTFQQYKFGMDEFNLGLDLKNFVTDLAESTNGYIYTSTQQGIYYINPSTGDHGPFEVQIKENLWLSDNPVNALYISRRNMFWIGTNEGLLVFDPSTSTLRNYITGGSSTSLSNNDIRCIYRDHAGTMWIGTYRGLNKVDQSPSRFTHFYFDPANHQGLSDNIVYSITEDEKGLLWIGTYGGINIYNRAQDKFSFIKHNPSNPNSLSSNKVRNLAFDKNGHLWAGTEDAGLNRIHRESGKVTRYYFDPSDSLSLCDNFIVSLMADSKGRVWAGTANGVNIIDIPGGNLKRLSQHPYNIQLKNRYICSIYEDRQGNFWLGTLAGLYKISPDFSQVSVYLDDSHPLSTGGVSRVFSTFEDRSGIYWFGTMGMGLVRYDPVAGTYTSFTEKNGLPNNIVYAVVEDQDGYLWITTNNGMSRFNPLTQTFVNYDTRDGLQGNEFNAGAYFMNPKGEIFFGGMNGFNVFHPAGISLNMVPPRMAFTRFSILNEPAFHDLDDGGVIKLSYLENVFSIEFSALDYTNPLKNLYQYMLENYDEGWIFTGAGQRRAEYRNINPGTYRFIVRGSNNDGIWNTAGISLTIIIHPPWWKTNLFRVAAFLLLIMLIWSIIYFRVNIMKRKTDTEKKMLAIEKQVFEVEQKALQLQMNPHFIFNSLNAIQNFILSNDPDKAVNYLSRFSQLMRMILANSSVPVINLKDELKSLTYYMDLEKLRFDNKFEYYISKDHDIDEEFVMIPPMLLQPFIENAVIHGFVNSTKPGRLDISFSKLSSGSLMCTIQDNGIGRERASAIRAASGIKRQPRGLTITQERIELLKKQSRKNFSITIHDLKDENGEPQGTRVEIIIQYKES